VGACVVRGPRRGIETTPALLGPLLARQPCVDRGKLVLLALAHGRVRLTRLLGESARTGEVASSRSQSARQIDLDIGEPSGAARVSLAERKRPLEQRNCLVGCAESEIDATESCRGIGESREIIRSDFLMDRLTALVQPQRFLVLSWCSAVIKAWVKGETPGAIVTLPGCR